MDGYNIIFSWDELRELVEENIHAACDKLKDILSNYQGYRKCTLILVFDAYKVEGHQEEVVPYHNIFVVYTRKQRPRTSISKKLSTASAGNIR